MADDSGKRRRGRNTGRRFARPKSVPGVPQESDPDLDLTPPPQELPAPDETAPLREQVRLLHVAVTEAQGAIARVWPARNVDDHLVRIDGKIETLQGYAKEHATLLHEFALPAVKDLMARCDDVLRKFPAAIASNEAVIRSIDAMSKRLDQVAGKVEHLSQHDDSIKRDVDDLGERLDTVSAVVQSTKSRVDEIEQQALIARTASAAITKQNRRYWKIATAIASAISLAGGWLANKFFK